MHFLYPLGWGSRWDNNELRYSLRSLEKNCQVDGVTIVGNCPKWIKDVQHVPFNPVDGSKISREYTAMLGALPFVPNEFIFMNDDFYVMEPIPNNYIGLYHQGTLRQMIKWAMIDNPVGDDLYTVARQSTLDTLQEFCREPMDYDVHTPMPLLRDGVYNCAAMFSFWDNLQFRTIYGNVVCGGQGEQIQDVKDVWGKSFYSTDTNVTEAVRVKLTEAFPNPSRFEAW